MIKLEEIKLQHGDVLHCTSKSWLARTIQKMTKSHINHTSLMLEIDGAMYVIDAQKNGVNLKTLENWLENFKYTYVLHRKRKPTTQWNKGISIRALSKVGVTPYDFASLLIWQPIYILTGKWKGRTEDRADDRFYCSEYVAWVLGLENWWECSPDLVYKALQKMDEEFILIS